MRKGSGERIPNVVIYMFYDVKAVARLELAFVLTALWLLTL